MFLKEQKLEQRIAELSGYRYIRKTEIEKFFYHEEKEEKPDTGNYTQWETLRTGTHWKGWDKYIWLAADVDLPPAAEGCKVAGLFDFGTTGAGNNSAFESLLYVDDYPYQGVDSNHKEVFFKEDVLGGKVNLKFRLWSGLDGMLGKYEEQEHKIEPAWIVYLHEETDDLYFNARAVLESLTLMGENEPVKTKLLAILDKSMNLLDWSRPGSEAFYQSVTEANGYLLNQLEEAYAEHPVTITGIGHTHIDVAWLWRLKHTREKCGRSFSTVLRLMEMFPEYIFLQTQPQLYDYVKEDYPEIYQEIKKRADEGRWEAGGGMWLESDANLPSGESLVRQLLKGQAFFEKEFGNSGLKYLWLPDVFGYSWALPQILKKSGIEVFMTTKISWNQYNRMPHDTFTWRGIDGSEILTHFITTPDPSNHYTYNGVVDAGSLKGIWDEYRDKGVNQELLMAYGYGDGGGGVNREMLEMRRRFDKVSGVPNVKTGRADDYFARLKDTVESSEEYVHTWDGELYLEYHRGTYTSQAYNKKMNRKLELMFREAESLDVLSALHSKSWSPDSAKQLHEGWKIILRNQFHDIIPGSSIREVYEDSKREYAEAETLGHSVREGSLEKFPAQQGTYAVFNASSWTQSSTVKVEDRENAEGYWTDEQGNRLSSQKGEDGWRVYVKDIPPFAFKTIRFQEGNGVEVTGSTDGLNAGAGYAVSPFYKVEWDENGHLTAIRDLEHDRDVLADGKGNVFQVFEDKPLNFDAWDIDIFYQDKPRTVTDLVSVEVTESGPLRQAVTFKWQYGDSVIEQAMVLHQHSRRIDFETTVDWQESNQLLKAAFPVNVRSTEATYDIQFGNVKRPTHWNTSWDMARFETVGHQWADLSQRDYGVSLLNDSKYGYDIKNNLMRLSLIKSATQPDARQDKGRHTFTYSLYPHSGDWYEGETVKEAWDLNHPLTCSSNRTAEAEKSLFKADVDHIKFDAVKRSEDGKEVIVRFHDYSGQQNTVELTSDFAIAQWQPCDLMENPEGEPVNSERITTGVSPYEIKSFRVRFKEIDTF
ncbi:alpha-mannosidase [Alteribacter lacisalsi]|uniref:Alpha-mannosidase n=1 Tax=Alteribacter lacisalsi TaxID=2045244 RepID=A0A2W0H6W2_9BACI|nr:alpha-mannosidase [Alteribacter lacisalsi]PYZ97603.1 alpha-mannosidase [Alteribacter lacisalsi]